MTSRGRRAVLLATALALVAGCGVPRSSDPESVAADRVPYRLLDESAPAVPSPSPQQSRVAITVPQAYFVDEDRLVPAPVPLEAAGAPAVVAMLLDRLAAGPTEQERARGLDSALGFGVDLSVAALVDGELSVEISGAIEPPSAERLPLAVGQIVLTATSVEGVEGVLLLRDGVPVDVPLPGGEQVSGPVVAAPYLPLLATSATRTTAAPGPVG